MKTYDHKKIEKKWQKNWIKKKVYKTLDAKSAKTKGKKPYYVLDMFPYPSGAGLHVGHPRGYIASDIFARMKRMSGFNVLHPMGFDSFGLPTEQYAIQTGKNPATVSDQLVKRYGEQLSILGFSYDWSRQIATHDPDYYQWTQWIFLQIYNSWYDKSKNKARRIDELVKLFEAFGNSKVNAVTGNDAVQFSAKEWKSFSSSEQQTILMNYRLAYEGYAEVNWCPEMGTVLANDEVIEKDGKMVSERGEFPVEKKSMRQWFMRITAYADRLLDGLEMIDWSNSIKEIQKNWIGKSEGSEIEFQIKNHDQKIKVFTTRADTLFGVTYVVLAPELELVQNLKNEITNWKEVEEYIQLVKSKSDEDRTAAKEKTGIQLKGLFAVNPVNNEQVPVWIADYVLAGYGTGAVMAVPAHDERDFEFAQKYDLPIKPVVIPHTGDTITADTSRNVAKALVQKDGSIYLVRDTGPNDKLYWALPGGSYEEGEDDIATLSREINEETPFRNIEIGEYIGGSRHFYVHRTGTKTTRLTKVFHATFKKEDNNAIPEVPGEWFPTKKAVQLLLEDGIITEGNILKNYFINKINTEDGVLINSGEFDEYYSSEARRKITEFVGGKLVTKYKMRDAIFARQRYWGEPIPLIHSKDGEIKTVSEKELPLKLPAVKSYAPSGNGEGPLAAVKSWVNAGYETNTMPGWAGSSWYFLRYIDPKNKKAFANETELDYWFGKNGGVNMYVGGSEHATGHLLYSRFWHKFLKDLGYVKAEEPFQTLRNQGLIMGPDGRKMSKRWGNVINPDDVVRDMGADTMRVYEAFMGPFESSQPWSTDGIVGSRRFIERVWNIQSKVNDKKTSPELEKVLHKTIKKVTDDITNFSFNTAVSSMMICINEIDKAGTISIEDFKKFLQILAPFAPHVADELWASLGEKKSIHIAPWPKFDPKKTIDDTVTIGIQINGKVRGEIAINIDEHEEVIKKAVFEMPEIMKWLSGNEIKKFIYVKGKVINIVI